jgi:hypothetical protein
VGCSSEPPHHGSTPFPWGGVRACSGVGRSDAPRPCAIAPPLVPAKPLTTCAIFVFSHIHVKVEATAVRADRDALAVDLKTAKDALDFYSAARQDHELLESALSRADMRDALANR